MNGELNYVQKAMVAAGIVQSAYNAPAAALILSWLLEKHPHPTREQIKDVLTSIFIRDAGYEHYYLAVKLACELRDEGEFKTEIAPSFRPQSGDHRQACRQDRRRRSGFRRAGVCGGQGACQCLVPARSAQPLRQRLHQVHRHQRGGKAGRVAAIITAYNCPDVYYMQAGQGNPEPSPHDRRLFNMKVRHVGDRVAGIVARTPGDRRQGGLPH